MAKESLLRQAAPIKEERERLEEQTKAQEEVMRQNLESQKKKNRDEKKRLENKLAEIELRHESSVVARRQRDTDGRWDSSISTNNRGVQAMEAGNRYPHGLQDRARNFQNEVGSTSGIKREPECVMYLQEEMSVVFLPCAHQILCSKCNDIHERQGLKDCPCCRTQSIGGFISISAFSRSTL